jgi:ppGpp synthetase/RelA/SpoT-type nucleotidyltranferase
MADTKLRGLLEEAEAELEQELKVKSKTLIKERLKEIRSMQKTLKTMEEQFESLLEHAVSDIEDLE